MVDESEVVKYEEEVALKNAKDMFEGGTMTNNQSWKSSLFEAHINSLVGAPLAVISNILLLVWSGIEPDWTSASIFATATWPIYFYLSVGRIYLFRRIFEKFGKSLEPTAIFKSLRGKK